MERKMFQMMFLNLIAIKNKGLITMTFFISNSLRITSVLHIQIFLCCWWWSEGWGGSYGFVKLMMQPLIDFYPFSLPPFFSYSSSVTQQVFLVVNGVLSSAYRDTLCSVPILKWLFQVSLGYLCIIILCVYNIFPGSQLKKFLNLFH